MACCSIMASRVRDVEGVKDAKVDILSMDLVVTAEGAKPDLQKILRGLREACSHGRR